MRIRETFVGALLCGVLLALQPGIAQTPTLAGGPGVASLLQRAQTEGEVRVIVGLRTAFTPEGRLSGAAATTQRAMIARAQDNVLSRLAAFPAGAVRRFESIPFLAARVGRAALEQLAAMPDVQSIEEDRLERPFLAESAQLIRADVAWQSGYTGLGWTVAVLDTGVDVTHPFLAGRIVSEACYSNAGPGGGDGMSLCPSGAFSSTSAGSGANCPVTLDGCEHGSHVAGIAAGRQYAGGPALNGIGRDSHIISVQVFTAFDTQTCGSVPCVLSYVSDQVAGLERVYSLRNSFAIAAVNMSLGGGAYSDQAECDANNAARKAIIDQLRSVGIATVIASGNDGIPTALSTPACISSAISVGSVDDGGTGTGADSLSADFSNGAPFLSLLAPGRWITSSGVGGFLEMGGTSMAAPHVAGAWALLKQRKPLASVSEILQALVRTGVAVSDPRAGGTSHARINVAGAIADLRVDYMSFDGPARNTVVTQPFNLNGWALSMSAPRGGGVGVDAVHVWAFPEAGGAAVLVGAATLGSSRPDVGALFGSQFGPAGWQITARGLAPGTYTFGAFARSSFERRFTQVAYAEHVSVLAGAQMQIDAPSANTTVAQPFLLGGWAVDAGATSGTGIDQVTVDAYPDPGSGSPPVSLGAATYGAPRPDLAAAFGAQFRNSGFNLTIDSLPNGRYRLVASARSTVSNTISVVRDVTVTIAGQLTSIDQPVNGSTRSQPFAIGGWAIDRGAASGTGIDAIHVWVYPDPGSGASPIFLGEATLGYSRPDVGAAFGPQFANSGYNVLVSGLPRGHTYRFAIYPHSAVSGNFDLRVVDVIVP